MNKRCTLCGELTEETTTIKLQSWCGNIEEIKKPLCKKCKNIIKKEVKKWEKVVHYA